MDALEVRFLLIKDCVTGIIPDHEPPLVVIASDFTSCVKALSNFYPQLSVNPKNIGAGVN